MSIEFNNFENSPLGQILLNLVSSNERLIEFKAFSREGFPAVTALVSEVTHVLLKHNVTDTRERNFVKQCIGDFVGRIMREARYDKAGSRSVPGKLFSKGALWTLKDPN